jgi:hypothetical protein
LNGFASYLLSGWIWYVAAALVFICIVAKMWKLLIVVLGGCIVAELWLLHVTGRIWFPW